MWRCTAILNQLFRNERRTRDDINRPLDAWLWRIQRPFFGSTLSRAYGEKQALGPESVGTYSLLKLPD
jgi:hypothetical protein